MTTNRNAEEKAGQPTSIYVNEALIGAIQPFVHDRIKVEDEVEPLENGLFRWVRRFQATAPVANVRLTMDFKVPRPMTYGLIPAVSYNGNPFGNRRDIKGFSQAGQAWTFAYHRTAVAGGTYSEDADWSAALFAQEGFKGACALIPDGRARTHRLIWPEVETPQTYTYRDEYSPPYDPPFSLEAGTVVSLTAYLLVAPVQEPRQAWRSMLDTAWRQHRYNHQPRHTNQEIWQWGIQYASESLWAEEGTFRGFSIGLHRVNESWTQHRPGRYEIGWCGQNASLANALLFDYLRGGSQTSLNKGLAALDAWAGYAPLPNGLFRCHFDYILAGPETPQEVQDGCNLGAAARYFFEADQLSRQCGLDKPLYRKIGLDICNFFVENQFEDGSLGRAWRNDGTCVANDGATGGFLILALLTAFQLTQAENYLGAARRAYRYYMQGLLVDGFTAAGALDTHCIDKESAIPLLQSGIMLYELNGDPLYLKWAEHAAYYLASWQWHHTVQYPPNSELNRLNYDTFGGTSVSTQHHHQDPFGLSFVPAFIKLAGLTGHKLWLERAQALWANGMLGVSDGKLMVKGKLRPVGSQDEGFFHTRWGRPPFDTSEWLVAWPTAFRLEVLRSLVDWAILDKPAA
jgi:hypothetical protein